MAVLGRWSGGVIGTMQPSTSWSAPNGLFPTQDRNDSSTYSFNSSTSTVTIPSSNLPDGYLLVAGFEFEDSSNGRHNPMGKFVQASGTGNFVSTEVSGYNRDTSEDRAFVRVAAVVDSPSASSTFQFQWIRDTDAPNAADGTVQSHFEIIPLYYSNIGMYSSSNTTKYSGATPTIVDMSTTVYESDTAAIQRTGNEVTIKTNNKRYLILGGYRQSGGGTRTQKISAITYDGTEDSATRGYSYIRQASCEHGGALSWDIKERVTTDIDVGYAVWSGPTTYAADNGASEDTGATPTSAHASLVIIELNDTAEVFRTKDGTGLQSDVVGTPVDLNIARTGDIDFNDSASWTRSSDTAMNAEVAMDAFLAGNVWTARASSSTARRTTRGHITVNGVEQASTMDGDYSRGDQSTSGTFAGGFNPSGFVALSINDDVGLSQTAITGTEGGDPRTQPNTVGFMGINLDTLEAPSGPQTHQGATILTGTGSLTVDGTVISNGIDSVSPTSFDMDETSITISGLNFKSPQSTGQVYLSDATTLAGSANEVNITSAVTSWNDTTISLNLTNLTDNEIQDLLTLDGGTRYFIVTNSSSDEYDSQAITLGVPAPIVLALGSAIEGTTTSRLTGGTGTFGGGRLTETANPAVTTTDLAADGYREDVWSLQFTKYAVKGATYEFEVHYGGSAADTVTVTPTITVNSGTPTLDGAANLTGTGSLSADAQVTTVGQASLSSTGQITADGQVTRIGSSSATASGQITADATVTRYGSSSLSANGQITSDGQVTTEHQGQASLSANGQITSDAVVTTEIIGAASLSATGQITADATVTRYAAASLSSSGSLTSAIGNITFQVSASFTAEGQLTTNPLRTSIGSASLSGTSGSAINSHVQRIGYSSDTAAGTLTATGYVDEPPSEASLSASGQLTASATVLKQAASSTSASGQLTTDPKRTTFGTTTLAATGTLTANATISKEGHASLSSTGSSLQVGHRTVFGQASLSSTGSTMAAWSIGPLYAEASLVGEGSMTVTGGQELQGKFDKFGAAGG